jgi:hypothetical protein
LLDGLGLIEIEVGPRLINVYRLSNRRRCIGADEAAQLVKLARESSPRARSGCAWRAAHRGCFERALISSFVDRVATLSPQLVTLHALLTLLSRFATPHDLLLCAKDLSVAAIDMSAPANS